MPVLPNNAFFRFLASHRLALSILQRRLKPTLLQPSAQAPPAGGHENDACAPFVTPQSCRSWLSPEIANLDRKSTGFSLSHQNHLGTGVVFKKPPFGGRLC